MKIHVPYLILQLRCRRLFFQDISSDMYNCIFYEEHMNSCVSKYGKLEYPIAIPYYKDWLFGTMRPIVDCWYDFVDTFKPYKSMSHLLQETLKPAFGLLNILFGISILILSVLSIIVFAGFSFGLISRYILFSISPSVYFFFFFFPEDLTIGGVIKKLSSNLVLFSSYMLTCLIEGVTTIMKGVIQIITYPFTLLIKIPFKALVLTPILGFQKFQDDRGMKRLIGKPETAQAHIDAQFEALVAGKLRANIQKATEQGRKLPYNSFDENFSFFKSQRIMNLLEPVTHFMLNKQKFTQLIPRRQLEIANKILARYQDGKNAKQETDNVVKILKEENLYVQRDIRTLIWAAKKGHIKGNYKIPKDVVKMIAGFMRPL